MPFTPTYDNLSEREPFKNYHYNTLIDDLQTALAEIDGTELAAPLTLSRSGQNLNGGQHYIYNFKKWFGSGGADVCVRDVCGYGATGDGSTDDSIAIQAAIDDCGVNGGCVFFPPGTYMVSRTILLAGSAGTKKQINLQGCGPNTVLKLTTAANCTLLAIGGPLARVDNCQVRDLKFDGNGANQTTVVAVISMSNSTGMKVLNCSVTAGKGAGLDLGDANDFIVQNSRFYSGLAAGIYSSSNVGERGIITGCAVTMNAIHGIHLQTCPKDLVICGNNVSGNTGTGIRLETKVNGTISCFNLNGNVCRSNTAHGIMVQSGFRDVMARDFVVGSNYCGLNSSSGIYLAADPGEIRNFAISGNTCDQNTVDGISLYDLARYGTIHGNICNNNGNAGILLGTSYTEAPSYVAITSNTCNDDQGVKTQDYGILLTVDTGNNVILANSCFDNGTAQISDLATTNDVSHNPGA